MKILIADDAPVVRTILQRQLSRMGHEVVAADDGEPALALLREDCSIRLLITDWRMPGMGGAELCARARELPRPRYLPIVVLTAMDQEECFEQCLEAGADAFLSKPVHPQALRAQIGAFERLLAMEDEVARQMDEVERAHYLVSKLSAAENKAHEDREEELREIAESLEKRVKERTKELAAANRELLELDRLRSSFFAVTSHELRTPLTVIRGMLPLIERMSPDASAPVKQMLASAQKAAKRLDRILVRALEFLEKKEPNPLLVEELHPHAEIVRDVVEAITPFVQLRKQQFKIETSHDLPQFRGDRDKIVDVLTHLLMNAVKFTPDNGSILLRVLKEGEGIRFEVVDSGSGVSEADKPFIFEEFFTSLDAERHSSGEYEFQKRGIGLGLATAKKFVEMHGGRIGFDSEAGKGSRFWFTLPAS